MRRGRIALQTFGPVLLIAGVITLTYLPVLRSGTRLNFNTDFLLFASRHESVSQSLRWYGEWPLRSQWFGGGFNTIADPEDPTFSPFILLSIIFGTARGLKLIGYVTMLVASLGTYGFARVVLRFTRWGALFSALVFGTCLFAPSRIAGGNINEAEATWLPLCLLLIGLFVQGRRWARVALAAVIYTMACDGKLSTLMAMFYVGVITTLGLVPSWNVFASDDAVDRSIDHRPLTCFVVAAALALLLGAPRFFPALEWIHDAGGIATLMPGHPQTYDPQLVVAYSVNDLWKGLLGWSRPINSEMLNRDLLTVGIVPIALCALAVLAFWRRTLPWVVALALFVWFAMAHHAPVDLLALSWKLPVFDAIYHPYKYFSCEVAFSIAIAGGYAFHVLSRLRLPWIEAGIAATLIAVSVGFLYPRDETILARVFTYDDPAVTAPGAYFNVVRSSPARRTVRALAYFNLRQNIGTLEGYSAVAIPTTVAPRYFVSANDEYLDNPAYRGEAYVLESAAGGTLGAPMFEPNRIAVSVQLNRPATLVINQNYDRDWHADHGTVLNVNGLLAVRSADAGAYTVHLTYRPRAFYAGVACSLTTLIALMAFRIRRSTRAPLKQEPTIPAADGRRASTT